MKQQATITSIQGGLMTLSIACGDACAGCAAKSLCGTSVSRTIVVPDDRAGRKVGDMVIVQVSSGVGLRAVALAYVVPTMMIVAGLLVAESFGLAELWSGVAAVGLVAVYFVLIKVLGLSGKSVSIKIIKDDE